MKKVAIVTNSLYVHGISMVIRNYLLNIDKTDLNIDLIAGLPIDDNLAKEIENSGVNIVKLSLRRPHTIIKYYLDLYHVLKRGNYDIMHLHCNSSTSVFELLLGKIAGIKILIPQCHCAKSNHPILNNLFKKPFNKLAAVGIAISQESAKWIYNNDNYLILNNAIDLEKFRFNEDYRSEFRKKYHISENDFVIGHIGQFYDLKNQKFLINLVNRISDKRVKLLLIGEEDISYKAECKELVKTFNLEDRIIIENSTLDIYKYYSMFDLFCLPSRMEGIPLVLLESQASGLKCLASTNVDIKSKYSNDMKFLSIDEPKDWIDEIINTNYKNRKKKSSENISIMTSKGLNIINESNKLREIYVKEYK